MTDNGAETMCCHEDYPCCGYGPEIDPYADCCPYCQEPDCMGECEDYDDGRYDGPMGIFEDYDDSMDGDFDSGMASAGFGTDEDYGDYGDADWLDDCGCDDCY